MSSQEDTNADPTYSLNETSRPAISSTLPVNISQTSCSDPVIDPYQIRYACDLPPPPTKSTFPSAPVLEINSTEGSEIGTANEPASAPAPASPLLSASLSSRNDTMPSSSSTLPNNPLSTHDRRCIHANMPDNNSSNIPQSTTSRRPRCSHENCAGKERQTLPTKQSRLQAKKCGRKRPCNCHPLIFPQRIRNIPTIRILRKVYSNVRGSNSLLGCALAAVEVTALCASAPAAAAWHMLPHIAATPLRVADLLLCKGLDLAQRALPCLTQTPKQTCEGLVFCACGVPVGLSYMACKGCCHVASACACDAPALCFGASTFVACSLAEYALCDAPAALCRLPARLTAAATQLALQDAKTFLQTVDVCAERFLLPFRGLDQEEEQ